MRKTYLTLFSRSSNRIYKNIKYLNRNKGVKSVYFWGSVSWNASIVEIRVSNQHEHRVLLSFFGKIIVVTVRDHGEGKRKERFISSNCGIGTLDCNGCPERWSSNDAFVSSVRLVTMGPLIGSDRSVKVSLERPVVAPPWLSHRPGFVSSALPVVRAVPSS